MKSICDECKRKRETCSDILKSKNYNGCSVLLSPEKEGMSNNDIVNNINADKIAKGWIINGLMRINYQLIVKNVNHCEFFISK